jgi:hypothetical protein
VGTRAHRDLAVLAYAAVCLLGLVQAVVLGASGRTLLATVPYAAALSVLVLLHVAGNRVRTWHRMLAGGLVVLAVWALSSFLLALPGRLGEPHSFYRVKVEVTTPLGDHNTAAGLLLVGVVACAVLAVEDRRWLAGSALVSLGIVATLSRGAAVVLVVTAAAGWFLDPSRVARATLVGSAAAVLAGMVLASTVLDASPPPGAADPEGPVGASIVGRLDLALRGLEVGAAAPGLGKGLGSFEEQAVGLPPPNDHAHQLVSHAFAEGGVPLLLLAVAVPLIVAVRGLRRQPGPTRTLVLLGGAALVGHAQFEVLGGRLGYEVVLATLAGLGLGAGPVGSTSSEGVEGAMPGQGPDPAPA